jgi:LemA protein
VPNLVATVQGYAAHERGVFDEVTRARAAAQAAQGPAASSAAEGPFVAALGRLMAVAENYPQLKANENFLQLQGTLADTENRIQQSRGYYNSVVQDFNRRVQAFPSNLIASLFHFQPADFFHIEESRRAVEAEPPRVDFSAVSQTPATPAPSPPPPPAG